MVRDLTNALHEVRLKWKPKSLTTICSYHMKTHEEEYGHPPRVEGEGWSLDFQETEALEALGTLLDRCGSSDAVLTHRRAVATKKYFANAVVLRGSREPC